MKTLELKFYGVQEMNHQEMVETEGGNWVRYAKEFIDFLGRVDVVYRIASAVDWENYSKGKQEMILKDIKQGVYCD